MSVLAEITENNLETGLRGIPVGYCPTSKIDPEIGLSYKGKKIRDLSIKDVEEVMFLLFNDHLPSEDELKQFKNKLIEHSEVHSDIIDYIESMGKELHPMNRLSSAILMLDQYYPDLKYSSASIKLIAKLPEIVANIFRAGHGWGPRNQSKPELGYIENLVYMMKGDTENKNLIQFLKLFHILHYDHAGGNLSAFVSKSTASGGANLYQSIAACMLALSGGLHGGANQMMISFVKKTLSNISDPKNKEELYEYLKKAFAEGEKLYGYGHAVLRKEDMRATILFDFGKKMGLETDFYQLSVSLREVATKILKENPKVKNPYPNVDSISGILIHSLLTQDETYYTVLFGFSRCVGVSAQIIYERELARNGKGVPIMRPSYIYSGPTE